jgi:hypothetical protein
VFLDIFPDYRPPLFVFSGKVWVWGLYFWGVLVVEGVIFCPVTGMNPLFGEVTERLMVLVSKPSNRLCHFLSVYR